MRDKYPVSALARRQRSWRNVAGRSKGFLSLISETKITGENLCHERPDYLQAVMMTAGAHGAKSNELSQIVQNNFNMVPNDSQMVIKYSQRVPNYVYML